MNIDLIMHFIFFIPLLIVAFNQKKLKYKDIFLKYLLISIGVLFLGILYDNFLAKENKSIVYYSSQMTITFLLLYKIIRIPYYLIFKREPEISKMPENKIDIIPTIIITVGTMALPFIIDTYIIQKIIL
ncbi:hypothetical protein [Flavobacterium sp. HNIBRBA15423]|uniref:hypothetical protein n=1 Tax=Flavobacterium sp. HNIBRBA15423 TaxID=3458683 RepID=UPI0040446B52